MLTSVLEFYSGSLPRFIFLFVLRNFLFFIFFLSAIDYFFKVSVFYESLVGICFLYLLSNPRIIKLNFILGAIVIFATVCSLLFSHLSGHHSFEFKFLFVFQFLMFVVLFCFRIPSFSGLSPFNLVALILHLVFFSLNIGRATYNDVVVGGIDNFIFGYKGVFVAGNELALYFLIALFGVDKRDLGFQNLLFVALISISALLLLSKVGLFVAIFGFIIMFRQVSTFWIKLFFYISVVGVGYYFVNFLLPGFITRQSNLADQIGGLSFLLSGRLQRFSEIIYSDSLFEMMFFGLSSNYVYLESDPFDLLYAFGFLISILLFFYVWIALHYIGIFRLLLVFFLSLFSGHVFFTSAVSLALLSLKLKQHRFRTIVVA